jgi:hypothetical protein
MTAMKYTSVAAPRFADAEGTRIDCQVVFPSLSPEPLPFTAADVDPGAEHSEEIFRRCLAGEFGPVAPWEEVQPLAGGFDVEATGADDEASAMPKLEPLPIARRASGHKPAKRKPAPPPAKKPPPQLKKRKPPAPAKPPKRKR